MSKLSVAEQIRNLADSYKAVIDAADAIEQIGSLEQATAEAQKALAEIQSLKDAAAFELADTKKAIADAKAKAKEVTDMALQDALAIREKAQAEAELITASASDQGQALIDKAKADYSALVSAMAAEKVVADAKLADIKQATNDAENRRILAESAEATAQDSLKSVQDQIRKLAGV